jgi:tRNA1(Val) A37 N6-methylase TrmN6
MIHRPDRFAEINDLLKKYQLEIKRVRFVHPYIDSKPNHVLIEAVRNGQSRARSRSALDFIQRKTNPHRGNDIYLWR